MKIYGDDYDSGGYKENNDKIFFFKFFHFRLREPGHDGLGGSFPKRPAHLLNQLCCCCCKPCCCCQSPVLLLLLPVIGGAAIGVDGDDDDEGDGVDQGFPIPDHQIVPVHGSFGI